MVVRYFIILIVGGVKGKFKTRECVIRWVPPSVGDSNLRKHLCESVNMDMVWGADAVNFILIRLAIYNKKKTSKTQK